jgi:hypothetical protein
VIVRLGTPLATLLVAITRRICAFPKILVANHGRSKKHENFKNNQFGLVVRDRVDGADVSSFGTDTNVKSLELADT